MLIGLAAFMWVYIIHKYHQISVEVSEATPDLIITQFQTSLFHLSPKFKCLFFMTRYFCSYHRYRVEFLPLSISHPITSKNGDGTRHTYLQTWTVTEKMSRKKHILRMSSGTCLEITNVYLEYNEFNYTNIISWKVGYDKF